MISWLFLCFSILKRHLLIFISRDLVFCLQVHKCTTCIQYPQRPEEGLRSSGKEATDDSEPPHGPGKETWSSGEKTVLLAAESFLQPRFHHV